MTTTKELKPPDPVLVVEPAAAPPPPAQQAPAGLFSRITRGRQIGPRKIMLYGTAGIGKSTFASMAPAPIFLPTEDGLRDIDCVSYPVLKTFEEVLDAVRELRDAPHDYKTVAIDSLDWLEQLIWTNVVRNHEKKINSIEEIGYGKGYLMALSRWRYLCDKLDELRLRRGMTVILIAHAAIVAFASPETEGYDRYVPKLHKSASGLVMEWCDEVLFATYEVFTRAVQDRVGERNLGVGTGERIIRTAERPFCIAKNRLNLPEKIKLDWREYAKFLPGAAP